MTTIQQFTFQKLQWLLMDYTGGFMKRFNLRVDDGGNSMSPTQLGSSDEQFFGQAGLEEEGKTLFVPEDVLAFCDLLVERENKADEREMLGLDITKTVFETKGFLMGLIKQMLDLGQYWFPMVGMVRDGSMFSFPEAPESSFRGTIHVVGDLHGNLFALNSIFERLGTIKAMDRKTGKMAADHILVFTGDLVDRGDFGVQVLMAVMTLVILNPKQVFLLSGNHESLPRAWKSYDDNKEDLSFTGELMRFLGTEDGQMTNAAILKNLQTMFNCLPSAMLVRCAHPVLPYNLLFVHGGPPPKAKMKTLLASPFVSIEKEERRQLEWSDYSCLENSADNNLEYNELRDIVFPRNISLKFMQECNITALFRGHQHNDKPGVCMMLSELNKSNGLVRLWNDSGDVAPPREFNLEVTRNTNSQMLKLVAAWKKYGNIWTIVSCGSQRFPKKGKMDLLNTVAMLEIKNISITHHYSKNTCYKECKWQSISY